MLRDGKEASLTFGLSIALGRRKLMDPRMIIRLVLKIASLLI